MKPSSDEFLRIRTPPLDDIQSQLDDPQMFNPYLSIDFSQNFSPQPQRQDNNGYPAYVQAPGYNPTLIPYWSGGTALVSPTPVVTPTYTQAGYVKPQRRRGSTSRSNSLYMPYAYTRHELSTGSVQPVPTSLPMVTPLPSMLYSASGISQAADQLRQFCADAERRRETAEPEAALTDRLLERLPKAGAPRGAGSRQGCEAYRCLWPDCGQEVRRKPNAIAHLLTHAGYKPFVCQEWYVHAHPCAII